MSDFPRQLMRAWPVVLAFVILGGLLGFRLADTRPVSYTGESSLLIKVDSRDSAVGDQVLNPELLSGYMGAFVGLATTDEVIRPVLEELGISQTSAALVTSKSIEVESPGPGLIVVKATADDEETAIAFASGIADRTAEAVNAGAVPLLGAPSTAQAFGPTSAYVDKGPAGPATMTIIGMMAGLIIGLTVVGLWVSSRRRVESLAGLRLAVADDSRVLGQLTIPPSDEPDAGESATSNNRALAVRLTRLSPRTDGSVLCVDVDSRSGPDAVGLAVGRAIESLGFSVAVAGSEWTSDPAQVPMEGGLPGGPRLVRFSRPNFSAMASTKFADQLETLRSQHDWIVIPLTRSDSGSIALVAERYADVVAVGVTKGRALITDVESQLLNVDSWSRVRPGVVLMAKS